MEENNDSQKDITPGPGAVPDPVTDSAPGNTPDNRPVCAVCGSRDFLIREQLLAAKPSLATDLSKNHGWVLNLPLQDSASPLVKISGQVQILRLVIDFCKVCGTMKAVSASKSSVPTRLLKSMGGN
jgi:hypothetical protein